MIQLRNTGLYSILLRFLCVILGSLLWRDRNSSEMWDELYVRQNTGNHAEQAVSPSLEAGGGGRPVGRSIRTRAKTSRLKS